MQSGPTAGKKEQPQRDRADPQISDLQLVRQSTPNRKRGQHGSERGSVLTSTRRTSTRTPVTRELETAHRREKERANGGTTKIIKYTLVSVPQEDVAKQCSGELRHEGQGGRRVTEHEGLRASLSQSKEELASMLISDTETGS